MNKLIKKELSLAAVPLTYFFIAFTAMTFIPGYPILVGAFFVCLGIFYSFQSSREFNDILYTVLLPIKKSDAVKAKYVFVLFIQGITFVITAVFTAIRAILLSGSAAYAENPLMSANLVYLGGVLLIYLMFNLIFLTGFFKTAYKIGMPFIGFAIGAFAVVGLCEAAWHFPNMGWLNEIGGEYLDARIIVFAVCLVLFVLGTDVSFSVSKKRFERVDL